MEVRASFLNAPKGLSPCIGLTCQCPDWNLFSHKPSEACTRKLSLKYPDLLGTNLNRSPPSARGNLHYHCADDVGATLHPLGRQGAHCASTGAQGLSWHLRVRVQSPVPMTEQVLRKPQAEVNHIVLGDDGRTYSCLRTLILSGS